MKPLFEIESIFEIVSRSQIVISAKRLNQADFKFEKTASLNNVPIELWTENPRAHDNQGNIRFDFFVFILKDKKDKDKFAIGDKVELSI